MRTLQTQLLIALVAPALLVLVAMAYFADLAVEDALEDALGRRLTAIAQSGATLMDARVLLLDRGDDESRIAKRTQNKLIELKQATKVQRVLVARISDGTVIADSAGELKIGDMYFRAQFDRAELESVAKGNSVASVLFRAKDGTWFKSGYAPLFDTDGSVRAGVAVQAPAEFFEAIEALRSTLAAIGGIGFIALFVLATISARRVSVPLSSLSAAAERIGKGDLETDIPRSGLEEANVLAETMHKMAASISARDKEMQLMLGGIAHEVRNPLGGIELFGGLLKEDLEEGDPRRKHVEKILKEIGVLANVVNNFLDFTRKRSLEPSVVDVKELVEEIVTITSGDSDAKKVDLKVDVDAALSATLDRNEVKRSLLNLVRNAIQATPSGGTVEITATAIEQGGIAIEVSDSGTGIPPEKLDEIFTPFFTTKQQGSGLGLALVKKCVEGHEGTLVVENNAAGGARFIMRLPPLPSGLRPSVGPPADEPGLLG